MTQTQAALLDRVGEVDRAGTWALDGSVTLRTWLAGQTRMTPERASETARVARSLGTKAATRTALHIGQIRLEHAEHTTRGMDRLAAHLPQNPPPEAIDPAGPAIPGLPDPQDWQPPAEVLANLEQHLLIAAQHLDARDLGVELRRRTAALAPLPAGRDTEDLIARRAFSLRKDYDGGWTGRFRLGTEDGALLEAARQAWRRTDHSKGDTRTPTQRDADALIGLVRAAVEAGRVPAQHDVRPHLLVTVPFSTWLAHHGGTWTPPNPSGRPPTQTPKPDQPPAPTQPGPFRTSDDLATLLDGEPIPNGALARLGCDARVTRIVLDPAGLPLDVGRTQRTIPPQIFLAAAHRDRGCVITGCHQPPERCEGHHVRPYSEGGQTRIQDIALVCTGNNGHHHQLHDLGHILRTQDGRWIGPHGWTNPPHA